MKYAIHLSTFTTVWQEDLNKYIRMAKEFGYDGVEIPLMNPYELNVVELKKTLDEYEMEAICGTGLGKLTDISSQDINVRKQGEAHLKKCIDCCEVLGSDQLGGVTYAPWGMIKPKSEIDRNNICESLRSVAEYAEKSNVTICMEVLNRFETSVINTVSEGLELLRDINVGNIKLHMDTFHAHIEENDIYDAIVSAKDYLHYIHFSENTRGIPLTGQVDWKKVALALKEINYDRWIGGEYFVSAECEVGNGCMIWRDIHTSGQYAAKQGIINAKKVFELVDYD